MRATQSHYWMNWISKHSMKSKLKNSIHWIKTYNQFIQSKPIINYVTNIPKISPPFGHQRQRERSTIKQMLTQIISKDQIVLYTANYSQSNGKNKKKNQESFSSSGITLSRMLLTCTSICSMSFACSAISVSIELSWVPKVTIFSSSPLYYEYKNKWESHQTSHTWNEAYQTLYQNDDL